MTRKILCGLACSICISFAGGAGAATDLPLGPYVLGGIGQASYDIAFSDQVRGAYAGSGFTIPAANLDRSQDTAFQIGGGYQILRWLAVELAYVDLGEPKASYLAVENSTGAVNSRNATYKLSGWNLSAVGTIAVTDSAVLFGRIGMFASELKYSETGTNGNGTPYSFQAPTQRQTNPSFGLGAEYRVTPNISVRASWDRFRAIGETFALSNTGNGKFDNVDLYSAGVLYRF